MLNVKKTPGKGGAVWSDLRRWVKATPGLLREEIAILAPDVVVAGGTYGLICQHVLPDDGNVCQYADKHCQRIRLRDLCPAAKEAARKVCILDSYHPAARGRYAKKLLRDARDWARACRKTWNERSRASH